MRPQSLALTAILLSLSSIPDTAASQSRSLPDSFTATTTEMTPAGVVLNIDVLEWSDEGARATVISRLTGEADGSLTELPTVGYVWPSGSAVGYILKYAYRVTTGDGERITVVTDRPVGAYDFEPWAASRESAPDAADYDYTVIELYLNGEGNGVGTMSLAADVAFDHDLQTVSLAEGDTALNVLTEARLEPKPYWAEGS